MEDMVARSDDGFVIVTELHSADWTHLAAEGKRRLPEIVVFGREPLDGQQVAGPEMALEDEDGGLAADEEEEEGHEGQVGPHQQEIGRVRVQIDGGEELQ